MHGTASVVLMVSRSSPCPPGGGRERWPDHGNRLEGLVWRPAGGLSVAAIGAYWDSTNRHHVEP